MIDKNFRTGDAKTDTFGSDAMLQPSPVDLSLIHISEPTRPY